MTKEDFKEHLLSAKQRICETYWDINYKIKYYVLKSEKKFILNIIDFQKHEVISQTVYLTRQDARHAMIGFVKKYNDDRMMFVKKDDMTYDYRSTDAFIRVSVTKAI